MLCDPTRLTESLNWKIIIQLDGIGKSFYFLTIFILEFVEVIFYCKLFNFLKECVKDPMEIDLETLEMCVMS